MIKQIAETGSTNADIIAALQAHQPVPEGYWLIADRQTSGRGRQGREWHGGEGNFMGSTVIKLQSGEYPGTTLNVPVSLALRDTIAEFIPNPTEMLLKWPNDVLLRGAKISGVLMELFEFHVVIGIGVNLASAPQLPDRETIALADILDEAPSRDVFANRLVHHVSTEIAKWRKLGDAAMRARWMSYAHPRGTLLAVHDESGGKVEGQFEGLHPSGALLLKMDDGAVRTVHAGDAIITAD